MIPSPSRSSISNMVRESISDFLFLSLVRINLLNRLFSSSSSSITLGTLARVRHPNIIRIIGAGSLPRRFIVLEWLGGGTLNTLLAENQQSIGLAGRFFHKPTFTYSSLLLNAKNIAEALDYLHFSCHPGATIIHRGEFLLFSFRYCILDSHSGLSCNNRPQA
jgi:serine/threonine protein kinase